MGGRAELLLSAEEAKLQEIFAVAVRQVAKEWPSSQMVRPVAVPSAPPNCKAAFYAFVNTDDAQALDSKGASCLRVVAVDPKISVNKLMEMQGMDSKRWQKVGSVK